MENLARDFKGVWIPREIWLSRDLSLTEKCLLVEIDSLDNSERGCFASNEHLATFLNLSAGRVANIISDLRKRGFIEQVFFDGRNRGLKLHKNVKNLHENVKADFTKTLKQPSRKREHSNTDSNTDKSIVGKPDIGYQEIIDLLNKETGQSYRHTSKNTRAKIQARYNEGYTFADFEKVIRHKANLWKSDPKMSAYLRPETLFGPKFEGYLQCANRASQINDIAELIDLDLTDDQANLYLEYYQHIRDKFPRLFATTKIIPASEYFSIRPGGKRHKGLSLNFSPGDLRLVFKTTHEQAAGLVEAGKQCTAILDLLNQNLSKR